MIRGFQTHQIRKTEELSSCLWEFRTLSETAGGKQGTRQVYVPSCWENYPGTESYRGKGSYTRNFWAKGNTRLEFKGVSHTATVLVDGEEAGFHYNAYTCFDVILRGLEEGEHCLEVIADNRFSEESALHIPNDYQSYGGISRPVLLESLGDAYIKWLHFTPIRKACGWFGKIELQVRNLCGQAVKGEIAFRLENQVVAELKMELQGNETKTFCTEELFFDGVGEWSPEDPKLYHMSAVLKDEEGREVDDLIERIGFREISVDGKEVLLNGKKLFIKGFCRHEDHPQFGCALPQAAMQQDLMLIKDLGGNSVRTSHYPNDELFLDLCDEQGILVWEENHARGLSEENMRNPNFERQCEDCIREMITAHYNHPSIYIWGILNECASHTEYGKSCYEAQYKLIRELDGSRPRSSASCQFKRDICFGYPEIVSYNIYPLWYHDTPPEAYIEDLYRWIQEETEGKGKPFYITEIGAGGIYGYRHPSHVKWTEEYQAEALKRQVEAVLGHKDCRGIYIWQLTDVRISEEWFGGRPRTMNNKGIVDEYRRPKLAYEIVRKLYKGVGNYVE